MLPNVRLMIAAMLASVVALICGFGMFAVFRVSHDPFARLPAATAPLQLVAEQCREVCRGRWRVADEPFDRRFQVTASPDAATQANAAAAAPELRGTSEPRVEPETLPRRCRAQSAATGAGRRSLPLPANQQNSRPRRWHQRRAKRRRSPSDNVAASDQANVGVSVLQPETTAANNARRCRDHGAISKHDDRRSGSETSSRPSFLCPIPEPAPHAVLELAVNEPPLPRARTMLTAKPTGRCQPVRRSRAQNRGEKGQAHPRRLAGYDACSASPPRHTHKPKTRKANSHRPLSRISATRRRIFGRRRTTNPISCQAGGSRSPFQDRRQKAPRSRSSRMRRPAVRSSARRAANRQAG